jgi:protein subunit release factor B
VNFPSDAPVTPAKLEALRAQLVRLKVDLAQVDEDFVRTGGPGGQKRNKTESGVQLRYAPLELVVKWARERSRALNRFLALRELADEIELRVSPETSPRLREQARIRKQKDRRRRRSQ